MDGRYQRRTLALVGLALIVLGVLLELGQGLEEPVTPATATVSLTIRAPEGGAWLESAATVEGDDATALGALLAARDAHRFVVEWKDYPNGAFVTRIFDWANEGACGWVYSLDGQRGAVAADRQTVHDGQRLEWAWGCG